MLNRDAAGATGNPFPLVVERGKILEFARAIQATDPAYFEDDPPIPPTFLTTMLFWEENVPGSNPWGLLEMDRRRGLHAEQEYVFHGPPPRAGARLTCRSRIDRVYEKEGRRGGKLEFAVMVTEIRDESGDLVAEAKLTGVETARPPEET